MRTPETQWYHVSFSSRFWCTCKFSLLWNAALQKLLGVTWRNPEFRRDLGICQPDVKMQKLMGYSLAAPYVFHPTIYCIQTSPGRFILTVKTEDMSGILDGSVLIFPMEVCPPVYVTSYRFGIPLLPNGTQNGILGSSAICSHVAQK